MFYEDTINDKITKAKIIIFASNGSLTKDGRNVMGKGVGSLLAKLIPSLPKIYGEKIKASGNHCYAIKFMRYTFINFPTKNEFWHGEDNDLIGQSLPELNTILNLGLKGQFENEGDLIMEYPLLDKHIEPQLISAINAISDKICLYHK